MGNLWEVVAGAILVGYVLIFAAALRLFYRNPASPSRRVIAVAFTNATVPWMVFWAATASGIVTTSDTWRWVARAFHVALLASMAVTLWLSSTYLEQQGAVNVNE